MALLAPLFLTGAFAAAIPIALHLLKRHPEALVRFATVRMLHEAPVEHASHRRLRDLLLLVLRAGALVLCAFAFSRPFLTSASAGQDDMVVVALDTSFSMSGTGRFERARALAIAAIDRAPRNSRIAVLSFDDTARVVMGMSSDRARARAAVATIQASFGATRYAAAVSTAADLMRGRSGRIVLVTDLQAKGWSTTDQASLPASVNLEVADIGPPPDNLAVTSLRPLGDRVVATVRNSSAASLDVRVQLVAGSGVTVATGRPAGEQRMRIGGAEYAELTFARPTGSWVAVRVDDRKGAAADNVRYAVLDGGSQTRVLVITATGELERDAFYLERALTAKGKEATAAFDVVGAAGSALQAWAPARFEAYAAIIVSSTRGLEHRGRQLIRRFLETGGGMLVAVGSDVDGDVIDEIVGGHDVSVIPPDAQSRVVHVLAKTDDRHPVLRPFQGPASLALVRFERVSTIRANGCDRLGRFTGGETALFECESGLGRALLFASDLDNRGNDFPRHSTFLPFVHEAIGYLAGNRPSTEYFVGAVPAGVHPVPGIALSSNLAGRSGVMVAVNVDPAESDPSRLTVKELERAIPRTEERSDPAPRDAGHEREAEQHLWQYVLVSVVLLLATESVVAMRTA